MKSIARSNFTLRMTISSGALLLAVIMSSCTPAPTAPAPKGGVALIDLDDVAKRLGRDAAIIKELQDAGNPMGEELSAARDELQGEFETAKSAMGAEPTEADQQKLAELEGNLNAQLQQKQQQAQQELNAKRIALVNRFREEVKPVALKIAAAQGLGVVIFKTENTVLVNDPDIDITDAVVAELTSASATPTPQ